MDVHVALPNGHAGVTIDELLEITVAAEEFGFDGVWPLDHVLAGPDLKDRYPWVIEPMTLLGYLAARTTKIRLGTSIIVLAMRNPFVVAKQAATLDLLCSGRFTLGLGAGYSEPEFRNVGAADVWSTRGQRLDEAILLFRHLWSGAHAPFRGRFYSYDEGWFGPPPPQGARLPTLGEEPAALPELRDKRGCVAVELGAPGRLGVQPDPRLAADNRPAHQRLVDTEIPWSVLIERRVVALRGAADHEGD